MKGTTSFRGLIQNTGLSLSGNWWRSVAVILILGILLFGLQLWGVAYQILLMGKGVTSLRLYVLPAVFLPLILFCGPLMTGGTAYFLAVAKHKNPGISCLFSGFDHFGRSIGVFWLTALLIFLWYLLLSAMISGILIGLAALNGVDVVPALTGGQFEKIWGAVSSSALNAILFPILLAILWVAGSLWIVFRHCLILFAFADDPESGVIAAVKRGVSVVHGSTGKLFGAWFLVVLVGVLLSGGLAFLFSFLTTSGLQMLAIVLNVIFGLCFGLVSYILPSTFLAVLYQDIKDTA